MRTGSVPCVSSRPRLRIPEISRDRLGLGSAQSNKLDLSTLTHRRDVLRRLGHGVSQRTPLCAVECTRSTTRRRPLPSFRQTSRQRIRQQCPASAAGASRCAAVAVRFEIIRCPLEAFIGGQRRRRGASYLLAQNLALSQKRPSRGLRSHYLIAREVELLSRLQHER